MKPADVLNVNINLAVVGVLGFLLLRPGGPVRSWIDARRASAESLRHIADVWEDLTGEGERLGNGTAAVLVVEFADYECVYCRRQHEVLTRFLGSHPEVAVVYRHLPLEGHDAAQGAARAAVCAGHQDRFTQIHEQLYAEGTWQADSNWAALAERAGLPDLAAFADCIVSDETTARLEEDLRFASVLGIRGTPTFVHRGGIHTGMISDSTLLELRSQ